MIIGNYSHQGDCEIRHIEIPENVTEIGIGAFSDCVNLESVTLNASLTRLRKEVFSGCSSLREIELPESLESIGEWAFRGCVDLEELRIPPGVREICAESFLGCSKLTLIAEEGSFAAEFARKMNIPLRLES